MSQGCPPGAISTSCPPAPTSTTVAGKPLPTGTRGEANGSLGSAALERLRSSVSAEAAQARHSNYVSALSTAPPADHRLYLPRSPLALQAFSSPGRKYLGIQPPAGSNTAEAARERQ